AEVALGKPSSPPSQNFVMLATMVLVRNMLTGFSKVRDTVVLPTPPLSAPTTITAGFAMSPPNVLPIAKVVGRSHRRREHDRKTKFLASTPTSRWRGILT